MELITQFSNLIKSFFNKIENNSESNIINNIQELFKLEQQLISEAIKLETRAHEIIDDTTPKLAFANLTKEEINEKMYVLYCASLDHRDAMEILKNIIKQQKKILDE